CSHHNAAGWRPRPGPPAAGSTKRAVSGRPPCPPALSIAPVRKGYRRPARATARSWSGNKESWPERLRSSSRRRRTGCLPVSPPAVFPPRLESASPRPAAGPAPQAPLFSAVAREWRRPRTQQETRYRCGSCFLRERSRFRFRRGQNSGGVDHQRKRLAPDRDLGQIGGLELSVQKLPCGFTQNELCLHFLVEALQPRRKVNGIAEYGIFHLILRADVSHNTGPAVNPNPRLEFPF